MRAAPRTFESALLDAGTATAAIDRAVDALYEHSEFRSVSLELFRASVRAG